MPLKLAAYLIGFYIIVPIVSGSIDAESWTKIIVPNDYWQPLNTSDEKAYGNRMACAVGCQLIGNTCKAFMFEEGRSECSFGNVVSTWPDNNYIPEYIKDGKEVSFRKSLLKRKELKNIVHLATLRTKANGDIFDAALERPDLLPVHIPAPPGIDFPFFTVQTYKNDVIVCGGKLPNNAGDKRCWHWSFKVKQWTLLGQTVRFHFQCGSAILKDRLYMFSGLNTPSASGNANRYVESYDLVTGTFHQHADVSSTQDLYYVGAVALPQVSKILLVNGREGTADRKRSYLYDATSDSYAAVGNQDLLHDMSRVDCVVLPDDENIVVCAGGFRSGGTNKVYLFDVTAETFVELEDDADRLPFETMIQFFNIDSQLYAVAYVDRLLKYTPGESSPWTELTDTAVRQQYNHGYFYTIDYHELLL